MIYSFLTSKGAVSFDLVSTLKGLGSLLNDKSLKVRFISLEGIAYLSTIEGQEKIMKILSKDVTSNKNIIK